MPTAREAAAAETARVAAAEAAATVNQWGTA